MNARSQDRFTEVKGQTETRAQSLGDYFAPPAENTEANTMAASAMPTATNDIVVREMAKKSGQARDFTNQQGEALASLRAFGDVLGDASRLQGRDASLVGQIGGFKRGSSGVLPLELDEASRKGQGLRTFGDILGGLGGVALNAGLTGGGITVGGPNSLFGGNAWGGAVKPTVKTPAPPARPATLYPQLSGVY